MKQSNAFLKLSCNKTMSKLETVRRETLNRNTREPKTWGLLGKTSVAKVRGAANQTVRRYRNAMLDTKLLPYENDHCSKQPSRISMVNLHITRTCIHRPLFPDHCNLHRRLLHTWLGNLVPSSKCIHNTFWLRLRYCSTSAIWPRDVRDCFETYPALKPWARVDVR
jgi:hypothetical protein